MKLALLAIVAAVRLHGATPDPIDFSRLPHFMVPSGCAPLAREAISALHVKGIPARPVFFHWRSPSGDSDNHVVTLFQVDGVTYLFDNGRRHSIRVTGRTDFWCAFAICPPGTYVCIVDETLHKQAPRKVSELFAPPPEWMRALQVGVPR